MNSSKKIARRLVLKENHPTAIKVAKLCDLANELGISLSFYHQQVLVTDEARDKSLPPLYIKDIEESNWLESFPFETEYKLIYENPEYIAQQNKEQEELVAKMAEAIQLEKEQKIRKDKLEAEERAKALETRERRMLAELKEKYENGK